MTYKTKRFADVLPRQYSSYARMKEATLSQDDYFTLMIARKNIIQSIPDLGEGLADELLLKLGSWLNETKR